MPESGGGKRVYHPRRFDGCINCKKLKVKCTREKPKCTRCQRLKSVCVYADPKVWTLEKSVGNTAPKIVQSVDMIEVSLQHTTLHTQSSSPASAYFDSLRSSGMQSQLIQQLYDSLKPSEEIKPLPDQLNWFEAVIAYPHRGPALGQMLDAIALKRFAFLHNESRFDQAGNRAYVTGLRIIQNKLSHETTVKEDDTIAAIRAAYTYEQLFNSDEGRSVSSHWRGLQYLVASGEPEGGWGKLGRISVRSMLVAQGQALLRDASGGSMTPLLTRAIRELDVIDTTDAIRLDRSVNMVRLISFGEKVRQARRSMREGRDFTSVQVQNLESEVLLAEEAIHALFPAYVQRAQSSKAIKSHPNVDEGILEKFIPEYAGPMADQPTVISSSQSSATKISGYSFFSLWLSDLLHNFEVQTGIQFELPETRKMIEPAYRITLSLNIVRAQDQLVNGPRSVLLSLANSYPLCLAHRTLAQCAPHLSEQSAAVIEKSISTGNGSLKYQMSRAVQGDIPQDF